MIIPDCATGASLSRRGGTQFGLKNNPVAGAGPGVRASFSHDYHPVIFSAVGR